jgi:nucleoside-diphosphate-sugar epimerase
LRVLILGGSGFVSGAMRRLAVAMGHDVWIVTRGQKPVPDEVSGSLHTLRADRNAPGELERVIANAGVTWDLAIDCIGYKPQQAQQDVDLLSPRVAHLVFISTDFVFEPSTASLPRHEVMPCTTVPGYGADKRACEEVLLRSDTGAMRWTVLRPCHIYGPGSLLGCLPTHGRDAKLIERLRAGEPLRLVGGGYFLQQPIEADDLAAIALACGVRPDLHRRIFCTAGTHVIESRRYYQIIADVLGLTLRVEELPVDAWLAEHPEHVPFLCHRIYSLEALRTSGLPMPGTSMEAGLQRHVLWMINR